MTETVKEFQIETKLDSMGRIMFPAYLRKAMGVDRGERVIIELRDGKLQIYKPMSLDTV